MSGALPTEGDDVGTDVAMRVDDDRHPGVFEDLHRGAEGALEDVRREHVRGGPAPMTLVLRHTRCGRWAAMPLRSWVVSTIASPSPCRSPSR